jgi:putative membrane protein
MNKHSAFLFCTLITATGLAAVPALASNPAGQAQTDESSGSLSTSTFVHKASAMGNAEVKAANMALEKSSSQAVKAFAQQMVNDHTQVNQKLMALAQQKGLKSDVATQPDAKDMALSMKLKMQSGASFDKAYASRQVTAHQETIALFQQEAQSGKDPDIKQLAAQALPTLQQHLKMAQDLARTTEATSDQSGM